MNDEIDLNDIPRNKIKNFPEWISEVRFDTESEIKAFLIGLCYPDDLDVSYGNYFQRKNKWVVRVKVGGM